MWLILQIEVFPYSVFYIFFEQYLDIMNTTVVSLSSALGKMMFLFYEESLYTCIYNSLSSNLYSVNRTR